MGEEVAISSSKISSNRRPWLSKEVHAELIRLSIPTVISTLAVPLLGVVDTAVLGRLPDIAQLAGAAAAGVIISVVFNMFFFLRMGTTALVAQYWGADKRQSATLVLFQSVVIAVTLGLLLILFRHIIGYVGFHLVGATSDVTQYGQAYLSIRIYEAPFYLLTLAMTAMMRGQGDALVPMYIVIGVNVINITGDLLLVPGTFGIPSFGIVGAAWASFAAQVAGGVAAAVIGWKRIRTYWNWDWMMGIRRLPWGRFFSVQSHLFVRTLALVLTMAAVTGLAARLESATVLAAHAILMQLWSLVSHGVDGFAYATETTVGSWLGRGRKSRAHASALAAMVWGVGIGVGFAAAYLLFVDDIAGLFTHNTDVVDIVVGLVWVMALSQPINAAAYVFDGIMIGATDTRYLQNAMLLSSAVFVAFIGLGSAIFGLSLQLVWWALFVFMAARAITLGVRFKSDGWYPSSS